MTNGKDEQNGPHQNGKHFVLQMIPSKGWKENPQKKAKLLGSKMA